VVASLAPTARIWDMLRKRWLRLASWLATWVMALANCASPVELTSVRSVVPSVWAASRPIASQTGPAVSVTNTSPATSTCVG
jgi:hypothetical protein